MSYTRISNKHDMGTNIILEKHDILHARTGLLVYHDCGKRTMTKKHKDEGVTDL